MKRLLPLLLLPCLLLGCASPLGRTDGVADDARLRIAPNIAGSLRIVDARMAKGASDVYRLQLTFENLRSDATRFFYRVSWIDESGMEIPSTLSSWRADALGPYELRPISAVAPSPAAVDFLVQVQAEK